MNELTIEQVQEFYDYLKGEFMPNEFIIESQKLSKNKAQSILYILQEYFHIMPNTFEICENCDNLFDTGNEGFCHDCEDCENKSCIELYPDIPRKKLQKILNYKYFCSEGCERIYIYS
jgi:hypothetical protein